MSKDVSDSHGWNNWKGLLYKLETFCSLGLETAPMAETDMYQQKGAPKSIPQAQLSAF